MLTVFLIDNPFEPFLANVRREELSGEHSPRSALNEIFPGFTEFEYPTICLVNGEPWLRNQWDVVIPHASSVSFVRLAEGVVEIIIAVVIAIVAVVVALTVVRPPNPASVGADDRTQRNGNPVYSLSGQQNQVKLNSTIECAYGRNKIYPAYAALPYTVYSNNEQYQYSLFCLGHGRFSIDYASMRFEDTPVTSLQGIDVRVYPPGASPTLIAARVVTSTTVSDIELYGTNEEEHSRHPVPYDVCEPGEQVNRIEIDLALPQGLFKIDKTNGKPIALQVRARFEYQLIDDASTPLGDWISLFSWKKKINTTTPQRYTVSTPVTPGRYRVRGRRPDKKSDKTGAVDQLRWEAMRSFVPAPADFGDVTLIAIKAKASNQLNNNSATRFNLIATRILPVWSPNPAIGFNSSAETRNPIWAFCDVFRAAYGARLSQRYLDMPDLHAQALYCDAAGIKFDYIFDSKSTVWEVAKTIALVVRAIPMLNGSVITMIRDQPRATAQAVFNQHNILEGSFKWAVKLPTVNEVDGIEVEYMDEATWVAETVLCLLGTDRGLNPERIKLLGCTDRTRAFQEGLYHRAVAIYRKEFITFKTGLEGHLPAYGSLVLVSHDVPRWGSGGLVEMTEVLFDEFEQPFTVLRLNNSVTFTGDLTHKIILRRKNGTAWGPVSCYPGEDAFHVHVKGYVSETFNFNDIQEPPFYLFGIENQECRRCLVVGIAPESDDVVRIDCVPYDDSLFSYGAVPTPVRYTRPAPISLPPAPTVSGVSVTRRGSPDFFTVYWPPSLGGRRYTVEVSGDGVTYTLVATVTDSTAIIPAMTGERWIRVAAYGTVRGPYFVWHGDFTVDNLPGDIENLRVYRLTSGRVVIEWDPSAFADSYVVTAYVKSSKTVLRSEEVTSPVYEYTIAMAMTDGLKEQGILFRVKSKNAVGTSDSEQIVVIMPRKPADPLPIIYPLRCAALGPTCDSIQITCDLVNGP